MIHSVPVMLERKVIYESDWVPKEEVLDILKNNRSQCGISMLGLLYAIQFCL